MNAHDVQALSDVDIHVYEAVASLTVKGEVAGHAAVVRATGLPDEEVRHSLAILAAHGYVVPEEDGFILGPHDFEVDY